MRSIATAALVPLVLAACASGPEQVRPAYVSPLAYQGLSCADLGREQARVDEREKLVATAQAGRAAHDAALVGAALFVPFTLLGVGSMGADQASELANLRGHQQAIKTAASEKDCGKERPAVAAAS